MSTLEAALAKAQRWMDEVDGVVGIAQGEVDGEDCITVFATHNGVLAHLPPTLDGFRVVVEFGGHLDAH